MTSLVLADRTNQTQLTSRRCILSVQVQTCRYVELLSDPFNSAMRVFQRISLTSFTVADPGFLCFHCNDKHLSEASEADLKSGSLS